MKKISEHLGEIIIVLVVVALLVNAVTFGGAPIKDFFSNLVGKQTDLGNKIVADIGNLNTNGSGNAGGSGGSGDSGESGLPEKGKTLEEYTWAEIKAISEAGKAAEYFNTGDTKNVTLTTGEVVAFEIADFNHDKLTGSDNKAGITFIAVNCLNTEHSMNSTSTNAGGWADSGMRSWLNGTVYGQLPADLQAVIKSVDKVADNGNDGSYALETSSDKLWLPSFEEVGFTSADDSWFTPGQGTPYSIFTNDASRVKNVNGSAAWWWLRSSNTALGSAFRIVNSDGSYYTGISGASYSNGVAPGFCI